MKPAIHKLGPGAATIQRDYRAGPAAGGVRRGQGQRQHRRHRPGLGPGAVARNTFLKLFPKEIAQGEKLTVILLDGTSIPGKATTNARRLVTRRHFDVLVGWSMARGFAGDLGSGPGGRGAAWTTHRSIVPDHARGPSWMSRTCRWWRSPCSRVQHEGRTRRRLSASSASPTTGANWVKAFGGKAEPMGLKLVAEEQARRGDTSVTGGTLDERVAAGKATSSSSPPSAGGCDAAAGSWRPAGGRPGFNGTIYQTHGAVEGLHQAHQQGATEGAMLPCGTALVVAPLLPAQPAAHIRPLEHFKGPRRQSVSTARHPPDSKQPRLQMWAKILKPGGPCRPQERQPGRKSSAPPSSRRSRARRRSRPATASTTSPPPTTPASMSADASC